MTDWKALKAEIDRAAENGLESCPNDVLRVFEYEIIRTGGGTGGTTLGPWFEGATASRYLGAYYCYNIIKLAREAELALPQIKGLVHLMMPKAIGTVELSGMEQFASFARRTIACIDEMDDRDEVLALIDSLYLYGSCINAWQNYRVKWSIGQAFHIPHKDDLAYLGTCADKSYL